MPGRAWPCCGAPAGPSAPARTSRRSAAAAETASIPRAAEAGAGERPVSPRRCVLSDRRSAYESEGAALDAALRREFELGKATIDAGESREGAARFAAGAGRHGQF